MIKSSLIPFVFFTVMSVLTPSTKEAIVIYGGGKILEYVENNEKIASMPDKVVDITDKYIDRLSKELEEEPKGE